MPDDDGRALIESAFPRDAVPWDRKLAEWVPRPVPEPTRDEMLAMYAERARWAETPAEYTAAEAAIAALVAEQVLDAAPPEATLVDPTLGPLQIATRGPDGTLRWQGATALSRADLIRLAGIVQQQAEPLRTTMTVRIKRVLDRDPTTGNIRTVVEWEVDVPLGPDGQPDLSALPPELPASR
jgi:hypothetical protein